jgi:hypothetical protein
MKLTSGQRERETEGEDQKTRHLVRDQKKRRNGLVSIVRRYESISAQADLSLQNGAVVMRPCVTSGPVELAEPRWFSTTNTMVINLINITSTPYHGQRRHRNRSDEACGGAILQ